MEAETGVPEMEAAVEVSQPDVAFTRPAGTGNASCDALQELSERKRALEVQVLGLRSRVDAIEKRQAERHALEERRRAEEIAYLKHQAKHLDLFLKTMPK
jgi:hypothetical protein